MQRPKHIFVSILILAIIGLHGLPILQRLEGDRQTLWPILAWGMYKRSVPSDKPVQTTAKRIVVKTSRGEEVEIHPFDVGLSSYAFDRLYIARILRGDAAAAKSLADRLNTHRRDNVVEVRLQSETYTITDTGLVKKEGPSVQYRIVN
jgi:hypothetical protein